MLFSLLTEFHFSLNSSVTVTAPFPPHLNSLSLSFGPITKVIRGIHAHSFPWKSIRVSFFLWESTYGKILTLRWGSYEGIGVVCVGVLGKR